MRDLTPSMRGATAAPLDEVTRLRAVVMCERALYGSVTPTTARLLADAVAADEAAAWIGRAQESAALAVSVDAAIESRRFKPGVQS